MKINLKEIQESSFAQPDEGTYRCRLQVDNIERDQHGKRGVRSVRQGLPSRRYSNV